MILTDIHAYFESVGASVRLKNSMLRAERLGWLPYTSMESFANNYPRSMEKIKGSRELGRKSLDELVSIVTTYRYLSNSAAKSGNELPTFEGNAILPDGLTLQSSIEDVVGLMGASSKLRSVLQHVSFRSHIFLQYQKRRDTYRAELISVDLFGKDICDEFHDICDSVWSRLKSNENRPASEGSGEGVTSSLSIKDVVTINTDSTRLLNVIEKTSFAEQSFGCYQQKRTEYLTELRSMDNVGKETLGEFTRICDDSWAEWAIAPCEAHDSCKVALPSIQTIILSDNCSVRLRNAIVRTSFQDDSFSLYPMRIAEYLSELRAMRHVGTTTCNEFIKICDRQWQAHSTSYGEATLHPPNEQIVLPEESVFSPLTTLHPSEQEYESLSTLLIEAIEPVLRKRELQVVLGRYGLGRTRATLEAMAGELGITRERVRQIENRALERLRRRAHASQDLHRVLSSWFLPLWNGAAAVGKSAIARAEYVDHIRDQRPAIWLMLDLTESSIEEYASTYATRWGRGWCRFSADTLNVIEDKLSSLLANIEGPVPLNDQVCEIAQLPVLDSAAVAYLSMTIKYNHGYVSKDAITRRKVRSIRVHQLFGSHRGLMDLSTCLTRYNNMYGDDYCTPRDLVISFGLCPSLFVHVEGNNWAPLGKPPCAELQAGAENIDRYESSHELVEQKEVDDEDSSAIAESIRYTLESAGPLPFVALKEKTKESLNGEKSVNSIGPVLLTSRRFLRILPGVYALPSHDKWDPAYISDRPERFINEEQARHYCYARRGLEDLSWFPFWCAGYEYELTRWAQREAPEEIFRSLLSICNPETWNVSSAEVEKWSRRKKMHGHFMLKRPAPVEAINLFGLDANKVLAATKFVIAQGRISWMSANAMLGTRLDAKSGISLLTALQAIGAIDNAPDWQAPHWATETASEILDGLYGWFLTSNEPVTAQDIVHQFGGNYGSELNPGWLEPSLILQPSVASYSSTAAVGETTHDDQSYDDLVSQLRLNKLLSKKI